MDADLVGRTVTVEVPATSANLGPGFDCFGLALDWRDRVEVEVTAGGYAASVTGEGAGALPQDASHLVIAAVLHGLRERGRSVPGLRVRAHNTIPHGRGLGSSSAAIVSGLQAALALVDAGRDDEWLLHHASAIEGHPDNVAAAIHGGFVLAYQGARGTAAVQAPVHPEIGAVAFVPETPVSTKAARGLLPATIPYAEAAANSGRAALLVHALGHDPALLSEATRDWLHQDYRRPAMIDSHDLMRRLRAEGWAAVISGAGPTVVVLGAFPSLTEVAQYPAPGFACRRLGIGEGVALVDDAPTGVAPAGMAPPGVTAK